MSDHPRLRIACLVLISLGLIGLEQRSAIAHRFSQPIDHHQLLIWKDNQSTLQDCSLPVGYRDGLPKRRKGGGSR